MGQDGRNERVAAVLGLNLAVVMKLAMSCRPEIAAFIRWRAAWTWRMRRIVIGDDGGAVFAAF